METVKYKSILKEIDSLLKREIGDPEANIASFPEVFAKLQTKKTEPGVDVAGWNYFNKLVGGLRPHEFSILCGPTGAGKTTILANLYASMMARDIPTFAAPVEVGEFSFARKVVSIISGIPVHDVHANSEEIKQKYAPLFFSNENMLVSKYNSRVDHRQLLADILHSYRTRGTKICLIDNLNFMLEPTASSEMMAQYDKIIHDWVVFHKFFPIHSIMVMHPKKTDNMRVESEGDIKGSSTAIQEAQNVFLFNRLEEDSFAPDGKDHAWCREIKIAKCRENGRAWGKKIIFSLDKESEKYAEEMVL